MKRFFTCITVLFLFAVNVNAGKSSAIGIVKKIRVFSQNPDAYIPSQEGRAYIYVDEVPGACGSNESRVAIGTDHPLFQSVVSLALVSKTTQTPVEIYYLDSCTMRGNAWDFSLITLQ